MIVIRWDAPYLLNDYKNFMESNGNYGGFCFVEKKFWGENVQVYWKKSSTKRGKTSKRLLSYFLTQILREKLFTNLVVLLILKIIKN